MGGCVIDSRTQSNPRLASASCSRATSARNTGKAPPAARRADPVPDPAVLARPAVRIGVDPLNKEMDRQIGDDGSQRLKF